MSIKMHFDVKVPFAQWEQTGSEYDPASRLLCSGQINGLPLHVEAYAVDEHPEFGQTVVDSTFEHEWRGILALSECAYRTVKINGRDYVIIAQPFGA